MKNYIQYLQEFYEDADFYLSEETKILYHGSNKDYAFDQLKIDNNLYGYYLTTSIDVAKDYGRYIKSFKLNEKAKILNLSDSDVLYSYMIKKEILDDDDQENEDLKNYIMNGQIFQYDISSNTHYVDRIVRQVENDGYDVVKIPDQLGHGSDDIAWIVINKNVLILQ